MRTAAVRAISVLVIGVCLTGGAAAQTPVLPLSGCQDQDVRGFTIRDARLEDPFWFLRWRKPDAALRTAIAALKGQPYTFDTVNAVSKQIESRTQPPDDPDAIVTLHYSDIGLIDCRDRQLDVVFRIFSATASATLSAVFESGSKDKTPDQTAGLAPRRAAWQVAPEAGFDPARGLAAGGRLQANWSNGRFPFGALSVKALASSESHIVSSSLAGEHESTTSWLQRANWRLLFDDSSMPAGATGNRHLSERSLAGQFSGTSRPMNGVVTRFGGTLNGGRLQSEFSASQVPAQTIADSDFTGSALFAGVTGRQRQQAFTASYALMFGATGGGFRGDWRKHIGDIAHEFWLPVGDHRLFELEQRLTLGRLQILNVAPATERFFAGAGDQSLSLNDDWRIPVSPRVRSIPTNRFALSGSGGDSFVAYNSTTALTLWRKPALPAELLDEAAFQSKLRGALTSAQSNLEIVYRSHDPSFQQIKSSSPDVVALLKRIEAAAAAARSSRALPDATFKPCEEALHASRSAADHAVADKPAQAYGWVKEMLPEGDNALTEVVSTCGVDLVAALRSAGAASGDLESASTDLRTMSSTIEMRFAAIDNDKWSTRASADLAYAKRALDVILNELNITSVSPVLVFDAAHLGPAGADPYGGTRYAIGGGIRLTLASTVNFTLTYAANPRRHADEGSGAVVFALTMRNLFD
jgi:hypothetical protein